MGAWASITLKQNSQNIANSTSSVTATVTVTTNNGTWNMNGASSTIKFTGNYTGTFNFTAKFNKNTTTTVYKKTFTVNHNSNGTARVSASVSIATLTSAGTISASKNLTLTTIPRASDPTVSGTKQLGSTITIDTNRKSTAFTHTIRYRFNSGANTGTIATKVGASTTYTLPLDFANDVTTKDTFDFAVICDTYNDSTNIGTKEEIIQVTMPPSMVPSFTSSDVNDLAGYLETYGAFVQNKSNIQVVAVAAGVYNSTISSYSASLGTLSASDSTGTLTLGSPSTAGTQSVSITATDSRGRSITGSKEISVATYTPPVLNINAFRCNTDTGAEDDESTTIRVAISGSVCNINDANVNTGTVKIEYKLHGSTDEWTVANEADRGQSFSFSYDIADLATSNKWDIRVTVVDDIETSTISTWTVTTARPILDFYKTGSGVAIGTVANKEDTLTLGYDLDLDPLVKMAFNSVPFLQAQSESGRPVFVNHTALGNGLYLQGQTASGGYSNILGMNASNQVELNWTSGGLRGRVMKQLWAGTLSEGGSVTVSELPYYNLFVFAQSGNGVNFLAVKVTSGLQSGKYIYGIGAIVDENNNGALRITVNMSYSGKTVTLKKCRFTSEQGDWGTISQIDRIYGLL